MHPNLQRSLERNRDRRARRSRLVSLVKWADLFSDIVNGQDLRVGSLSTLLRAVARALTSLCDANWWT
jgi:hypothetical protein